MKCRKCKEINVSQANYCYKCKERFTKKEQENARNESIWYKIRKAKDWYDTLTISKITGSIWFQILSIIIVLIIGINFIYEKGSYLKIEDSSSYTYNYNAKEKEYYLYLKENEAKLNIYVPHQVENFTFKYFDEYNNILKEESINDINNIKVTIDNNNPKNYYKISVSDKDDAKNTIKFYVFRGETNE